MYCALLVLLTMIKHIIGICSLAALVMNCKDRDADLVLTTTESPIAVGALYSFSAGDACRSARFSGCSTDKLVEWKELTSNNPSVIRPRRVNELPENLRLDGYPWVLEGVAPGEATVTLTATFDDGSEREGVFEVEVDAPASTQIVAGCESHLFPVGSQVRMGTRFRSSSDVGLVGLVPDSVEGEGIQENFGSYLSSGYLWDSSLAPNTTARSTLFPGTAIELRSFSASQMDVSNLTVSEGHRFIKDFPTLLDVSVTVFGEIPCEQAAFHVESHTPSFCLYEGTSTEWTAERGRTSVTPLTSGTCTLALAPEGTDRWTEFSFTYELD